MKNRQSDFRGLTGKVGLSSLVIIFLLATMSCGTVSSTYIFSLTIMGRDRLLFVIIAAL